MKSMHKHTSKDYLTAFRKVKMLPHYKKMLQIHYFAPAHTLTATQMSKAMGYKNFNAANLHYGKRGRAIGRALGWIPKTTLYVLAEFEKPGNEWQWILRPEVKRAIEAMKWNQDDDPSWFPEEAPKSTNYHEGSIRSISVNAYERSAPAREKCILHYGCKCSACNTNMADIYGELAQGHIHVHHLRQLSEINKTYQVNPITDLRPVCPNCHAIIHLSKPPKTIEQVKALIAAQKKR